VASHRDLYSLARRPARRIALLLPGLFLPVLTIRGVLTREGIVGLRSTIVQPSPPHTGRTSDPMATLDALAQAGAAAALNAGSRLPSHAVRPSRLQFGDFVSNGTCVRTLHVDAANYTVGTAVARTDIHRTVYRRN
jgi:hypothetical protein